MHGVWNQLAFGRVGCGSNWVGQGRSRPLLAELLEVVMPQVYCGMQSDAVCAVLTLLLG